MVKEEKEIEFLMENTDDSYEAYVIVDSMDSTFGVRHPSWALLIYTVMALLISAGIAYNLWMHNILGVVLFFILRVVWRARAKRKLGIPEAHIQMTGS